MVVWDHGVYELLARDDPVKALEAGKLVMGLRGKILQGGFTLVQMKGRGEKNWLLIKKKDEYGRTDWATPQALTEQKKRSLREKVPPCEIH